METIPFRIMRHYHGKAPVAITKEEAEKSLAGYYENTREALILMWRGGRCQTAGGWYWIERGK